MNELNKTLEHNGFKFNIKIELNIKTGNIDQSKIWHSVIVNDMGATNYYKKYAVDDSKLKHEIEVIEHKTKEWADEKNAFGKTDAIKLLNLLGYE